MILTIIGIILLIVSIILIIISRKINTQNESLFTINKNLKDNNLNLENKIKDNQYLLNSLDKEINIYQQKLNDLQNNVSKTFENQKELSQKAFENYCELLEKQYEEQEEEYNNYQNTLQTAYSNEQLKLMRELDEVKAALDKIKATRAAAIQAQTREKEIEENKDNYRLNITEVAMKDIRLLKSIQKDISNAIVIDKIIWSNYYQPLAKVKFPKIIGKDTTCGIYKLTNLITGEAYIGQSTDCCDRWKQHCKNALGVGNNSSNNKLYKSMREDGLYNFTFEIIEECPSNTLDEKEKYYIDLYNTYNFGLNGNRGNNG